VYFYIYPKRVTTINNEIILGFYNYLHGIRAVSLAAPILGSSPLPHRAAPGEIFSSGARHPIKIID
jgi:hypothetical protein